MQVIKYPSKETWQQLSQRPTQSLEEIEKVVSPILDDIKLRGDAALFEYAEKFDKARISNLLVTEEEITAAIASIDVGLKNAIDIAYNNILYFHYSYLQNNSRPTRHVSLPIVLIKLRGQ